MSNSLQPHGLQHTKLPRPSPSPGVCSSSCPVSLWWPPTISSSVAPLLLLSSTLPCIRVFPGESALHIRWQRIETSASASVHWKNWVFRVDFPYRWLVWSPCCLRDSQEPSLELQLEDPCQFGWWTTELGYSYNLQHSWIKWEGIHFHMFRGLYLCWEEGWKLSVYVPYAVFILW